MIEVSVTKIFNDSVLLILSVDYSTNLLILENQVLIKSGEIFTDSCPHDHFLAPHRNP